MQFKSNYQYTKDSEPAKDPENGLVVADMNAPKKIKWKIDKAVEKSLGDAQIFVDKLIADSDLGILHFENYGSDWIKKNGF